MTILAPIVVIALITLMAVILTFVSYERRHPPCPSDHDPDAWDKGYGIPANFDS